MKKELGLVGLLVLLCLTVCGVELGKQLHAGATLSQLELPRFLSQTNLTNTANLIGLFGIFSIGTGLVIITGGIDLSVGSLCALVGVLLAMALSEWHWPWPLAVGVAVLVPMLLGWAHGWLITRMRMQPFIVTLCGLLIYRGAARYLAGDATKGFTAAQGIETLRSLTSGKFLGMPMPFVMLIVIGVVMWFVLHRSVYGRYLLAVGRNEEAARFSGINTRLIIAGSYVMAGLLAGISAIGFAFYTNSISPSNHGNFYELYGIAAAVLGGCSLRGGEGSILGILIGTTLLLVLQNLVNLLEISSSLNFAVMGSVVLVGVLADQILQKRRLKSSGSRR
jgi:ribose transport system permease protein